MEENIGELGKPLVNWANHWWFSKFTIQCLMT